ncbi:MAG: hypothetical protein MHM6MM_000567 [Cercozoa sp. M6MM]
MDADERLKQFVNALGAVIFLLVIGFHLVVSSAGEKTDRIVADAQREDFAHEYEENESDNSN